MLDLTAILRGQAARINYLYCGKWSLEAQLEVFVGGYFLRGSPDSWQLVYHPVTEADVHACLTPDHIVAVLWETYSVAFVRQDALARFEGDTAGYGLSCYPLPDLFSETLCCSDPAALPQALQSILWIDDRFLDDETLPFDFDAFALIDDGRDYLNPAHFSIIGLAKRTSDIWL